MDMQFTEKLWLSKEEQWIREAMIRDGVAEHCTAMIRQGNALRSNAVARNSFARQRRSMEPKGQATQRLGKASHRAAADMQSKDLIGNGDEWPGQAVETRGKAKSRVALEKL